MEGRGHESGKHRDEGNVAAVQKSLQKVDHSKQKTNRNKPVDILCGNFGGGRVLANGDENRLGEYENQHHRQVADGHYDQASIEITTAEIELLHSKSLRNEGLQGSVQPDQQRKTHHVNRGRCQTHPCQKGGIAHPPDEDQILLPDHQLKNRVYDSRASQGQIMLNHGRVGVLVLEVVVFAHDLKV